MKTLTDTQAELISGGADPLVIVNVPVQTAVNLQGNLSNQVALAGLGGTASNTAAQGNDLRSGQSIFTLFRRRR